MHVFVAVGHIDSVGIEFASLLLESIQCILGNSDCYCLSSVCLLPNIIVDVTTASVLQLPQSTECAVSRQCVMSVEVVHG
jgi:hypothetical protein